MSEVSPFSEQFEMTHAIVWGGQYLTLCKAYRRAMFPARSRVQLLV